MKSDRQVNPRHWPAGPGRPLAVSRAVVGIAALVLCLSVCGCFGKSPGTQMAIGPVAYDRAFTVARGVMAQYFTTLDQADSDTGVIRSRPRFIEAGGFSISDPPPARQLARLTIRPDGTGVTVRVIVAIQRQGSESYKMFRANEEDYSRMRSRTPGDLEAATTRRQNELWETYRYDRILEHTILRDLTRLLTPVEQPSPR